MAEQRTERDVLHHLVNVCENGALGFTTAAKHVKGPRLKALFEELSAERTRFVEALTPHLLRLGGRNDPGGTSAGSLHRGLMELGSLVPGNHDHHLVIEAKRGEQLAIDAYNEALSGMLPPTVIELVEQQRDAMISDSDRIRTVDMGYE
ncbi:MAG: PA2169 family four-helix-bundle protein [Acidobacteria bacterium]|nr:PA2169 family four-helix-bundle protein [Acidobacteriota bacterium]